MNNRYGVDSQARGHAECPNCGRSQIETTFEAERFKYGKGSDVKDLEATIPVRRCLDCGFQFTDAEAEEVHHEAVCCHLGVLTPREIVALRSRYGLSRSEFAEITKIGEASLHRWETGQLIQNPGYDQLLYLLTYPVNMERLRERGSKQEAPSDEKPSELIRKFPNVTDISAARKQAGVFQLRRTGT